MAPSNPAASLSNDEGSRLACQPKPTNEKKNVAGSTKTEPAHTACVPVPNPAPPLSPAYLAETGCALPLPPTKFPFPGTKPTKSTPLVGDLRRFIEEHLTKEEARDFAAAALQSEEYDGATGPQSAPSVYLPVADPGNKGPDATTHLERQSDAS
ncbi:hypothetical protein HK104_009154 [Borealophlyctis nickersoniae]|nr:hypothetical protein HK104_009154 [Borealophlyctis nickersoniae]